MRTTWIVLALAFAGVCVFPTPSSAQDATAASDEEARRLFEAGDLAFRDGRYETALTRFHESYDLSHRPALLYNIAVCLDRLRRDAEAIEAYDTYLAALPDAANRDEVEGRLRAMREAAARAVPVDEGEATGSTGPTPTPTPGADSGPRVEDFWWAFVIGGVVVAAAVVVPIVVVTSSSPGTEAPLTGDFGTGGVLVALEVRP